MVLTFSGKRGMSLAVVVAVLNALSLVQATSIEYSAVTPVEDVTPLDHRHPAFGADPETSSLAFVPILKMDPNILTNITGETHAPKERRMETTSQDVERLEHHFGEKLERNFDVIKEKYAKAAFTPAPWSGSYWPTYGDSINTRWDQQNESPAEKYAAAYGMDKKDFTDKVSQMSGVLWQNHRTECSSQADCDALKDNSACGKRHGESKGRCIPKWFGICHAWATAAIEEPEPSCAVTKGNVTFKAMDIKGLVTQFYDGAELGTVFTGVRFYGPDEPAEKDKFGRYTDAARRDLGPGFFHIAVTNIMGRFKKSFIVDVSAGAEVWNMPVRSYDITQMEIVDPVKTAQQFYQVDEYPFNKQMKKLAHVKMTFKWIVEAYEDGPLVSTGKVDQYERTAEYEYLLELDDANTIIGGEWVGQSHENHPDFLWFPIAKPAAASVSNIGIKYQHIKELVEESVACKGEETPSPSLTPTPSSSPSAEPSSTPSSSPSAEPSSTPSSSPSAEPTSTPSETPSSDYTPRPSSSDEPTPMPTTSPSSEPSSSPSKSPAPQPSDSSSPSPSPSSEPSKSPAPTSGPTPAPSRKNCPTKAPRKGKKHRRHGKRTDQNNRK